MTEGLAPIGDLETWQPLTDEATAAGAHPDKMTVRKLAIWAVSEARRIVPPGPGDERTVTLEADRLFRERIADDLELKLELLEPLIATASFDAIRSVYRETRQKLRYTSQPTPTQQRAGVAALSRATERSLLDWPLSDGSLLGDATAAFLIQNAEFYERQARTHVLNARWLRLIADRVPEGVAVRDVLTNADLETLEAQARQ